MAGVLVVCAAGCGLISSDVENVDLVIGPKMFSVDTSSWNVSTTAADAYLSYDCSSTPTYCASAVTNACTTGCSGACDATSHTCDLGLDISIYQPVNLLMEQPELKTLNSAPVIHVTVDSVSYTIDDNTLSVDTPMLTLYVAPITVMDPNDPSAEQVGTIAPVPAGHFDPNTAMDMTYTADGKANLVAIMGDYKTPFNVIVGGQVVVTNGDAVPTGKLDAGVTITAHAAP
ncbi:MAG TPA: hypothetical protein VMJ10_35150 [Kofleriaceae bacterium]|nr:hypothetical protein [Kofleriaceae bacterium]